MKELDVFLLRYGKIIIWKVVRYKFSYLLNTFVFEETDYRSLETEIKKALKEEELEYYLQISEPLNEPPYSSKALYLSICDFRSVFCGLFYNMLPKKQV